MVKSVSAKKNASVIYYDSIKFDNGGEISLSIYPPGEWQGSKEYHVFVGGCGVGTAVTLKEAEKLLAEAVRLDLQYRIDAALDEAFSCHQVKRNFKLTRVD